MNGDNREKLAKVIQDFCYSLPFLGGQEIELIVQNSTPRIYFRPEIKETTVKADFLLYQSGSKTGVIRITFDVRGSYSFQLLKGSATGFQPAIEKLTEEIFTQYKKIQRVHREVKDIFKDIAIQEAKDYSDYFFRSGLQAIFTRHRIKPETREHMIPKFLSNLCKNYPVAYRELKVEIADLKAVSDALDMKYSKV
jgi:hypothetical protein